MRQKIVFMLLLWYGLAVSSTFYIDFASGSDANNGTNKTTPWKRHPYMVGWTGSYSHSAGDRFIFKGGVTWDHTCYQMSITTGGTTTSPDYYGVDKTWYTGGSFSRPILNGQNQSLSISQKIVYISYTKNIIFDNFEIDSVLINTNSAYFLGSICGYGDDSITIKNCYIHGWYRNNNLLNDNMCGGIIFSNPEPPLGNYNTVDSCIVTDSAQGGDFGFCIRNVANIKNSTISWAPNLVLGNCLLFCNNIVHNGNLSFDPTQHANAVYIFAWNNSAGPSKIYNNTIYNTRMMALYIAPGWYTTAGIAYVYNNILYNNENPCAITIDPENATASTGMNLYIYNNTIVDGYVRVVPRTYPLTRLEIINNHVMNNSGAVSYYNSSGNGTVTTPIETNNLLQTAATSTSQGYSIVNQYAPTIGGATIDRGTNLSSIFNFDLRGTLRSQGSAWDIGTYEYVQLSNPLVITSQPINVTTYIGQQAIFTVEATGTGMLTYQWYKSGITIPGATNGSFTTSVLALGDNGTTYACLVKDDNVSTMSQSATLTVNQTLIPTISMLVPSSGNYIGGYNVHLSSSNVLASGGKPTLLVGSINVTDFTSTENSVDFSMPFGPVGQMNVILTNYLGRKDTAIFTRDSSFYFASVSPISSKNGTILSYRGGGFKPNQGTGTITMDSVFIITSWSDTLIQAQLNLNRILTIISNSTGSKDTLTGSIIRSTLTF